MRLNYRLSKSARVRPAGRYGLGSVRLVLLLLLPGLIVTGCEPGVKIQGLVTDTTGAPLPGVAVKVKGTERFAISNGNGAYGGRPGSIRLTPGAWELEYIKTGFTTAEQSIVAGETGSQKVPTVVMWPLPSARGIYDRSTHRYRTWTRVEPERYLTDGRTPVFGTRLLPEFWVDDFEGPIIGFKVPPYDWRMSRLELVSVLRDGAVPGSGAGAMEEVWAEAARIPVHAVAVDEPERLLWEIRPVGAIEAGVYAVHWGAFEGDPTTAVFAYLLEVGDPTGRRTPPEVEAPDSEGAASEVVQKEE